MKRRAFLAAASLLSLMATPSALAANKKPPPKKTAKPSSKKNVSAQPATTAKKSILDAAHPGSSATRLPPVKAPELPPPNEWRAYEIKVSVRLAASQQQQRLWLPLPMNQDTRYQRALGCSWQGNFSQGSLRRLPDGDLETFHGEWPAQVAPQLDLSATVSIADRRFDVSRRTLPPEREDIPRRNLQASLQLPNEGRVYTLARQIIGRALDPVAQARLLFSWIADHAAYDTNLPGCGTGDVRAQLEACPDPMPEGWRFTGRSADINGLFVAMCRAIGIPARRVWGLRVAPSRLADCLGVQKDAACAAHCRAEFYIPGYYWIPVDPSDVCRVVAVESLAPEDEKSTLLRKVLFGVWEMNWIAYNTGEDVTLPGGPVLPFFTFPWLERAEGNQDGMNAEDFAYHIKAYPSPADAMPGRAVVSE